MSVGESQDCRAGFFLMASLIASASEVDEIQDAGEWKSATDCNQMNKSCLLEGGKVKVLLMARYTAQDRKSGARCVLDQAGLAHQEATMWEILNTTMPDSILCHADRNRGQLATMLQVGVQVSGNERSVGDESGCNEATALNERLKDPKIRYLRPNAQGKVFTIWAAFLERLYCRMLRPIMETVI